MACGESCAPSWACRALRIASARTCAHCCSKLSWNWTRAGLPSPKIIRASVNTRTFSRSSCMPIIPGGPASRVNSMN
jgi:hypothetical protein